MAMSGELQHLNPITLIPDLENGTTPYLYPSGGELAEYPGGLIAGSTAGAGYSG